MVMVCIFINDTERNWHTGVSSIASMLQPIKISQLEVVSNLRLVRATRQNHPTSR